MLNEVVANIASLPLEILQFIFVELQDITSGPRYSFYAQLLDAFDEIHDCWSLSDPGPLYFASTCRTIRNAYLSDRIPGNLVLEIPPLTYAFRESPWRKSERDDNLLQHLKRMKHGKLSKPLTRFMLDSKWDEISTDNWIMFRIMAVDIFKDVVDVFGDELMVAICCHGERVQEDYRRYAPKHIRDLEISSKSLRRPLTSIAISDLKTVKTLSNIPSSTHSFRRRTVPPGHHPPSATEEPSISAPLSLHVYFGVGQSEADLTMGDILGVVAYKNLESLYFCSDPNNLDLCGISRRPILPQYNANGPVFDRKPWWYLSKARETLKNITLDCSMFWSEIAYELSHLHKLETLDCGLTLLHSDRGWPYRLESQESASLKILDTCLNSESNQDKDQALKNDGKKWIQISRDAIVLPLIKPEVKPMPRGQIASRFHTVDIKTCRQFMRGLVARARQEE